MIRLSEPSGTQAAAENEFFHGSVAPIVPVCPQGYDRLSEPGREHAQGLLTQPKRAFLAHLANHTCWTCYRGSVCRGMHFP